MRRLLPALLTATLLALAACGGDSDEAADDTGSTGSTPPATGAPATDLTVVDLSDNVFELALLGVPIAGGIYGPEFLEPSLDGLEGIDPAVREATLAAPVVTVDGLNLDAEQLALVDPDVILVNDSYVELYTGLDVAEQFGEVVVIPDATWQERTLAVADAVGLREQGEARVQQAEAALEELGGAVTEAGREGSSVSLLRAFGGVPYAFIPPSVPSQVLETVGLTQPAAQGEGIPNTGGLPDSAALATLSEEVLGQHDADVLVFSEAADGELATFTGGPVAATLGAVQSDRVGSVPYFLWALNTAAGVERIVADLQRIVVEEQFAPV